jgi:uncharacterized protein (DUF1778 family)
MPKLPRADSPAEVVGARLSREERERLEEAARLNRQSISEFVRDAIADRADATLDEDERPNR